MNLLLIRFAATDQSTLGLLYSAIPDANKFQAFTLEDPYQDEKIAGNTRIPEGAYKITLRTEGGMHSRYSARWPWHKGMLWLRDVPNFEWIYLHPGNTAKHTEGCILVGDSCISNVPGKGSIGSSQTAYERLYKRILASMQSGADVSIQIRDLIT